MSEEPLGELLGRMVEEGLLKFGKDKDEQPSYILEQSGLKMAEEVLGGRDVANVASALTKLLVKHGNAIGGVVPDDVGTWLTMVQVARLWKQYSVLPWHEFVAKLEREVLEPEGYFKEGFEPSQ